MFKFFKNKNPDNARSKSESELENAIPVKRINYRNEYGEIKTAFVPETLNIISPRKNSLKQMYAKNHLIQSQSFKQENGQALRASEFNSSIPLNTKKNSLSINSWIKEQLPIKNINRQIVTITNLEHTPPNYTNYDDTSDNDSKISEFDYRHPSVYTQNENINFWRFSEEHNEEEYENETIYNEYF